MPSILSLNTVPADDIFSPVPSPNSVLFSSAIADLVKRPNFPSLFANSSIPSSKLQSILGTSVAQTTLSGYRNEFSPGQIAYKTITSYNIGVGAVGGLEGGNPPGTVIYYYGLPPEEGGVLPEGYLKCNGSFVLIENYPALFAALDYRFGADGESKFRLPTITGPANSIALIKY
jgi:hypothetical protein